ncbi:AAA family ATPase [Saliphagus sp. LR7]|uniref:AAA family ATPase n=1 Tax=Saliphagus sp. LR7 TaxID=2282654 RepID=UPI000DF78F02|nr:AAA family ATPase [Saliphagus sp. LR7]
MNRIAVMGPPGAGKSTFSRRLGERTELPVIHLDAHYWGPNWEGPPTDEWRQTHRELIEGDAWIIDGNYGSTAAERLDAADTVIFLESSRYVCLFRVLKRRLLRDNPAMAEGCSPKVEPSFLLYTWRFNTEKRPSLKEMARTREATELITLRSSQDREGLLTRLG